MRREIMTAYRQHALLCAEALRDGEASTRILAASLPGAPAILLRNVYGWFERVSRGTYRLSPSGKAMLERRLTVSPPHDSPVAPAMMA